MSHRDRNKNRTLFVAVGIEINMKLKSINDKFCEKLYYLMENGYTFKTFIYWYIQPIY